MKMIKVRACNPKECPLCMPDMYAEHKNYCMAQKDKDGLGKMIRPVKTFPKTCPLKDI
jgi:hypothetical protein